MKLSDFNYFLPKNLIAQKPKSPRDSARLLVIGKNNGSIRHKIFHQLDQLLKPGDVLVFNKSKVIPARIWGRKETGGKIEILLIKEIKDGAWEALLNRKVKEGEKINISKNFWGEIISLPSNNHKWKIQFNVIKKDFDNALNRFGEMPVPPYIKSSKHRNKKAEKNYQTIYADPKKAGSVAAPTAGLHFTKRLLKKLKNKGVQFEYITLHVGLGTFEPVRQANIKNHKMHAEFAEIDKQTLERLRKVKSEGRRIIAVGTTAARALESFSSLLTNDYPANNSIKDWINIFIYPGYKFKVMDGMITNFHLPKSTLLMLVSAFAGKEKIKKAYREAIKEKYRFYSYGDGMLII